MGLFSSLFGKKDPPQRQHYQRALNTQLANTTAGYQDAQNLIRNRLPGADERDAAHTTDIANRNNDIYGAPSSASGYYEDLAQGGGLDPNDVSRVRGIANQALSYGKNPISEEDKARLRGGGVYDEFSKTGGWTGADVGNFRARVASQTPSFYSNLRDRLNTRNAATGSSNPGFGASMRALARESARGSSEAVREGELGLHDSIMQGRQWGASGMTSSENALQNLLQNAMLGGLNTAGGLESGIMGARQQGKEAGAAGLLNVDQQQANQRLNATQGLQNLYNTPGESDRLLRLYLDALGQGAGATGSLINSGIAANPQQPSLFDNLIQAAGAVAPFLALVAGTILIPAMIQTFSPIVMG